MFFGGSEAAAEPGKKCKSVGRASFGQGGGVTIVKMRPDVARKGFPIVI